MKTIKFVYFSKFFSTRSKITGSGLKARANILPDTKFFFLKDLNSIKEYCKKDEFKENMDIEYIKKTIYFEKSKRYSIQNIDYNYRINLKVEQELGKASSETIDVLDDWKNKKKYFRRMYN